MAQVVFDNAGGITLQLDDYAHTYHDDVDQVACDLRAWMSSGTTDTWDGDDEDADFEVGDDDIRNGGYRVVDLYGIDTVEDLRDEILSDVTLDGWGNAQDLARALAERVSAQ